MRRLLGVGILCVPLVAVGLYAEIASGGERPPASLHGTCLDSAWARYYQDYYRHGRRERPEMDAAIDRALAALPDGVPDNASLRRLTQRFSTDFATLVLADRLVADPTSRLIRSLYEEELERVSEARVLRPTDARPDGSSLTFLFVPGWMYRSFPDSGADLAMPRRVVQREGWASRLIRVPENTPIDANAHVIARTIRAYGKRETEVIIVSLSKGGPETAMALGTLLRPEETRHVLAWYNVCGLLKGTRLIDIAVGRPLRTRLALRVRIGDGSLSTAHSGTTWVCRQRFSRVSLPEHLLVVNYIGVPLSCHLQGRETGRFYRKLRQLGPNDGCALLADQIVPDTPIVAEFGIGHRFQDTEMEKKTTALVRAVVRYVRLKRPQPSAEPVSRGPQTTGRPGPNVP